MEGPDVKEMYSVPLISVRSPNCMSWSEDHKISVVTSGGIHIIDGTMHQNMKNKMNWIFVLLLCLQIFPAFVSSSNITGPVFGSVTNLVPAAFGDFNSDELTDLFAICNKGKTLEILLAYDQEPLLRAQNLHCHYEHRITSVVPGDFDGDTHMDVLVTLDINHITHAYISWGGDNHLNCSKEEIHSIKMKGQPLALHYDHNMIIDLFGTDIHGNAVVWLFDKSRTSPITKPFEDEEGRNITYLRDPHSHAFFDVNDDNAPDLYLSTIKGYDIWIQNQEGFKFNMSVNNPPGSIIGQSSFIDLELEGVIQHLVPVCFDDSSSSSFCQNSTIFVYHKNHWSNLNPNFKDTKGNVWGFVKPKQDTKYSSAITLRAGDFNMDGYPDLLATLGHSEQQSTFLLENVPCDVKTSCEGLSRSFLVRWDDLSPLNRNMSMAVFYDFYQDGVLDIILATEDNVQAFRNSLDYDANFVKVMVLAGGERGTSLPGPRISYRTTTQEGEPRTAISTQLPQSAYFALGLPYSIFGLGRTPNFVDTLTVGVGGQSREWTQIIPNSQMVVIPFPPSNPSNWRARLFVTPSKLILLSVAALTGTCGLIVAIIVGLYLKERREDRIEKLQEAHRFHFDAM